jgi:hypothetical protein
MQTDVRLKTTNFVSTGPTQTDRARPFCASKVCRLIGDALRPNSQGGEPNLERTQSGNRASMHVYGERVRKKMW